MTRRYKNPLGHGGEVFGTKWVKLKDRKPRYGQRCLLFIKETGHIMAGYYYPRWYGGGFCDGRDSGHAITGVTEWLPWPK